MAAPNARPAEGSQGEKSGGAPGDRRTSAIPTERRALDHLFSLAYEELRRLGMERPARRSGR